MIAALAGSSADAAVIAVIDSGTDLTHSMLKDKQWTHSKDVDDAVDNDDNGYIDDVHGWNFAENDNRLIEKKRFQDRFTDDVYKFFEIQARMILNRASPADETWMREHRNDEKFIQLLMLFGNYAHGTHVAGLAAMGADGAQVMPLKLITTEVPKPFARLNSALMITARQAPAGAMRERLLIMGLKYLGSKQAEVFTPIGAYLKMQGAQVANCSFGTSQAMVKQLLKPLVDAILRRTTSEVEMEVFAGVFVKAAMDATAKALVGQAGKTLFVMAAGNDGVDNDENAASPANIKMDNTITVAATMGTELLASFSNYGQTMVEIAAPGVGIVSSRPGSTETVTMSGTGQAAPQVAAAAGRVLDANPHLTPLQVKKILMRTVDLKTGLQGKVVSSGILNADRAVQAALQALAVPLDDAIARSRTRVADARIVHVKAGAVKMAVMPLMGLY